MLSISRKILFRILIVGGGVYLGVLIVLLFFENRLVYPLTTAEQDWQPPPSSDIQDVELTTMAGLKLHAWWCPYSAARSPKETAADGAVLYCHGNGGNLSHRGRSIVAMSQRLKMGVLIFDYPGYGKSEGKPSEIGCYAAADAAYDWLADDRKIDPGRIVLYGGSLGGGVAVDLASRRDHRALILAKTFTSMPDVGQTRVRWLPVRWLMHNRYNSLNKIEECRQPVFIAGSKDDEVIPYSQSVRLFEAANEPKEFFELHGGHNAPLTDAFLQAVAAFLRDRAPVCMPY
jgi:uncharacterized protein